MCFVTSKDLPESKGFDLDFSSNSSSFIFNSNCNFSFFKFNAFFRFKP